MSESRASFGQAIAEYIGGDQTTLAVRIFWIVLLFDPIGHQVTGPLLYILAFFGLTNRRLVWHPLLWWAAAICCAVPVFERWVWVDNHDFLRAYWALSVAVCASTKDPAAALRRNGRLMIGLVFLSAVIWKGLLSPDFMDGRFFRFKFMTDLRFAEWSELLAGLSIADQLGNHELVKEWMKSPTAEWPRDLVETPGIRIVALVSTWWTIFIESAIAAVFLWLPGCRLTRYRDAFLLIFVASTYALANVEGFGWILCAIGIGQVDPDQPRIRLLYVGTFILILLYDRVPWVGWVLLYTT